MKISKFKKYWRIFSSLLGAVIVIVLLLYLSGVFIPGKIRPERKFLKEFKSPLWDTAIVEQKAVEEYYEAVGTIQSKTRIHISSQINGQIEEVFVRVGQNVEKGQALVRIERETMLTMLNQAKQSYEAARAARQQAVHHLRGSEALLDQVAANYKRMKSFYQQKVITDQQMEEAQASYNNSLQTVEQAKQRLRESAARVKASEQEVHSAEIQLGYTLIKATENGVVAEKLVEPGDLAWPGKLLLIIHNPYSLRLEANIREHLVEKMQVGDIFTVIIDAVNLNLQGNVDEIVPSADPKSRSFLIKVALPYKKNIHPGMFGRLLFLTGTRQVILVPFKAIYQIGQLEMVQVQEGGSWYKRYVRTGNRYGENVEILSGLKKSEIVAIVRNMNSEF
jgi:RND family efflux transporter, MFP subunit